jgi:hypothetical protein
MDHATRLIRITREILLPLFVLAAFVSTASFVRLAWTVTVHGFSQQQVTPDDISKEPHHRLLLENSQVRVFELTIPPGQQTIVQHEHNFLTVMLEDSEVITWKDDESPIQHFRTPKGEMHFFLGKAARGIRNDSNAGYRNVTVEFLDPQITNYGYSYATGKWDFGPSAVYPPLDPEGHFANGLNLVKAAAEDVQLLPKESLPAAKGPQLLIAITPLTFVDASDRMTFLNPGEVIWREAGDPSLTNNGLARARFAMLRFQAHVRQH